MGVKEGSGLAKNKGKQRAGKTASRVSAHSCGALERSAASVAVFVI
jgi:hypothetical protein